MKVFEKLNGSNGEKGIHPAISSAAQSTLQRNALAVDLVKSRWSAERLKGVTSEGIHSTIQNVRSALAEAPGIAVRMDAYQKLVSMALGLGVKTLFADTFTAMLKSCGSAISSKKFLESSSFELGGQLFNKGAGVGLSNIQLNAFINNVNNCLCDIFANEDGVVTQNGKRAISSIMRKVERHAAVPSLAVGTALHELVFEDQSFISTLKKSLISDSTISAPNTKSLDKTKTPAPSR